MHRHGRQRKILLTLIVIPCLSITPALFATPAVGQYSVTLLPTPTGTISADAVGISSAGVIGASALDPIGSGYAPTLWQPPFTSEPVLLPLPTGFTGGPTSINDAGDVVGGIVSSPSYAPHPVLWHNGQVQLLDTLGVSSGVANAINNHGTIAGTLNGIPGDPSNPHSSAAIWTNGQATVLGGFPITQGTTGISINDLGQVLVRTFETGVGFGAAIWEKGHITSVPSPTGTSLVARALNNHGHIVGNSYQPDGTHMGLFYNGSSTVALPTLPGDSLSTLSSINDSDQIVGNGNSSALLWQDGNVYDLNNLIPQNSGWTLIEALAISDDGTIAGDGIFNGQSEAFLLTPTASSIGTPEPTTLTLLTLATPLLLKRRH